MAHKHAPNLENLDLDFSVFDQLYKHYNQIWSQVIKLPVYGENLVNI